MVFTKNKKIADRLYDELSETFVDELELIHSNKSQNYRFKAIEKLKEFEVSKEPVIGVISSQVFAWAKGDFKKLKENYQISILNESPIEVKLEPMSSTEKKYIASIILTFSETDNYVERLEINETKGGCTQITFTNMVMDNLLEEDIF